MTRPRPPRGDTGDEPIHRVPPDFEYIPTPPIVSPEPVSPEVAAARRRRILAALADHAKTRPGDHPQEDTNA